MDTDAHARPLSYAAPTGRPRPHLVWLACGLPIAAFSAFLAGGIWWNIIDSLLFSGAVSVVVSPSLISYVLPPAAITLSAIGYRRSRVLAILAAAIALVALLAIVLTSFRRPDHII